MTTRQLLAGLAMPALLLSPSCTKEKSKEAGNDPKGDASAIKILRFSAIPDENTTEQAAKFQKFADYLAEKLEIKTEFVPAADYDASVSKFVNGEIHLAWFGGLTGVQARAEVEGARAIAQGTEDPKYISYFIANESTGLELSDEFPAKIKDLKFTFGSEKSTSGRLMPSYFIMENTDAEDAVKWFTNPPGFSGAHDKTAKLVQAGTFDVGALSYKKYDSMVEKFKKDPQDQGGIDPAKCKIIWKTPYYADYNWTAHPALGNEMIGKLQKVLTEIDDPELLKALTRSGIITAKNEDFDGVVEVAKQLGLLN